MIILANTTVRRAARARLARPAPLAAAAQRARLANLSVSPLPRSDPGMTDADRIDGQHTAAAAAALVEDDGELCATDGDAT